MIKDKNILFVSPTGLSNIFWEGVTKHLEKTRYNSIVVDDNYKAYNKLDVTDVIIYWESHDRDSQYFIKEIKNFEEELNKKIPVIVIFSKNSSTRTRFEWKSSGAHSIMKIPIHIEKLIERLDKIFPHELEGVEDKRTLKGKYRTENQKIADRERMSTQNY